MKTKIRVSSLTIFASIILCLGAAITIIANSGCGDEFGEGEDNEFVYAHNEEERAYAANRDLYLLTEKKALQLIPLAPDEKITNKEFFLLKIDDDPNKYRPGFLVQTESKDDFSLYFVHASGKGITVLSPRNEKSKAIAALYAPFPFGKTYTCSQGMVPGHIAFDFMMPGSDDEGEAVGAACSGKVVFSGWGGEFGNTVVIKCDGGGYFRTAHHDELFVYGDPVNGQYVKQGQTIATLGNTGRSTGYHIHCQLQNSAYSGSGMDMKFADIDKPMEDSRTTSKNSYMFDKVRTDYGPSQVGQRTTTYPTRPTHDGLAMAYNFGSYGRCEIYYELLGFYPPYNNTNFAWLVRGKIYAKYVQIGGPGSWLGYPTGNQTSPVYGNCQTFKGGRIKYDRVYNITTASTGTCP